MFALPFEGSKSEIKVQGSLFPFQQSTHDGVLCAVCAMVCLFAVQDSQGNFTVTVPLVEKLWLKSLLSVTNCTEDFSDRFNFTIRTMSI